ncbi:MAG: SUF system NifU family Fe-S cluster assembly protein [Ignavibacteria bacterium]|nr:SUF system NifU family Fe-S cluster assembly protein [Ignavibacteria bacterium]
MTSELRSLYQEIILDHNKSPRNFRKLSDANRTVVGYNPLCGDHYTLYVRTEDDIIKDIGFQGSGCAISKASASVMTTIVKGKTHAEAEKLFEMFHKLVTGELSGAIDAEELGKLAAFSGVSEFPARVKCASLVWHTLSNALQEKSETVTTE